MREKWLLWSVMLVCGLGAFAVIGVFAYHGDATTGALVSAPSILIIVSVFFVTFGFLTTKAE